MGLAQLRQAASNLVSCYQAPIRLLNDVNYSLKDYDYQFTYFLRF